MKFLFRLERNITFIYIYLDVLFGVPCADDVCQQKSLFQAVTGFVVGDLIGAGELLGVVDGGVGHLREPLVNLLD